MLCKLKTAVKLSSKRTSNRVSNGCQIESKRDVPRDDPPSWFLNFCGFRHGGRREQADEQPSHRSHRGCLGCQKDEGDSVCKKLFKLWSRISEGKYVEFQRILILSFIFARDGTIQFKGQKKLQPILQFISWMIDGLIESHSLTAFVRSFFHALMH